MFFKKNAAEQPYKSGKPEFIIAGLGNPGKQYEYSRHNAGFLCLDMLCNKYYLKTDRVKFRALTCTALIEGIPCLVMRPQTFMNSSGEAIKQAADFYKIPPEKIIIIFDDISLPMGTLRIRRKGSAGGHNGIKSIIYQLASDNFPRLKLGVGDTRNAEDDLKDYVLGNFSKSDLEILKKTSEKAVEAVGFILKGSLDEAMNRFNG